MVARLSDAVLDSAVLLLAAWTVFYHLCLVTGIGAVWAALAEVLLLPCCVRWAWRGSHSGKPSAGGEGARDRRGAGNEPARGYEAGSRPAPPRALRVRSARSADFPATSAVPAVPASPEAFRRALATAAALSALVAAVLFALRVGPWWLTWALWSCAAVAGTAGAFLGTAHPGSSRREDGPLPGDRGREDPFPEGGGAAAALAWATGLATFALFLNRPDGDDAYYVNLAGWVAEHGTFPLRDTVMSDLAFPATYWPPVASYDALLGTLGRFSPLDVLDVAYFVVPVVGTFLAVLALWRLLRVWSVPAAGVALTLAAVFLLWGGDHHYAFGNHFVGRIWQGKILFLWLMVPLLLCYLQRFAEGPSRRRLARVCAAGVAAVGFSTNAMFLVPLIAAGGVTPLLFRAPRFAGAGFVAAAAYPLGAGGITLAVGGYVGDDYASMTDIIVPEWLTHLVLGDGLRAGIAVLAVLAGALVLRRRDSRITVGALATVAAVMYAPGMPLFVFELTGLGRTLHRVLWILPVAALLGALGSAVVTATRMRAVRYGVPGLLAVVLVATGLPLWSPDNTPARLTAVPRWKLPPGTVATAQRITARSQPGDTVLVPYELGHTVAITDPPLTPVLPRPFFANALEGAPDFHGAQRRYLKEFAKGYLAPGQMGDVPRALRVVGVDMACLHAGDAAGAAVLERGGYVPVLRDRTVQCYRPAPPSQSSHR